MPARERSWALLTGFVALAGFIAYAIAVFAAPGGSPLVHAFNAWVYPALFILAAFIVWLRAIACDRDRSAWMVITLALGCWAFGEIFLATLGASEYPSPADFSWLAFYPLVFAGIVLLLRPRARSIPGTLWLDGVTASLGAAALGAAVLFELVLRITKGSLGTVVTNLAYPLGDVLLLSAVFGVFSLTGWRPRRRWLLFGLGLLAAAIAGVVSLFQFGPGTNIAGTPLDVLWPASVLLIAAAAWTDDGDDGEFVIGRGPFLAVPAACALLSIGIFVFDAVEHVNVLAVVLAAATLLAVVIRLAVTSRENRRLLALTRHEAVTDALTGLANRRKLVADLERRFAAENPGTALLIVLDLDGFKSYNDSFGHPAGDALLGRLGAKLASVASPDGFAYRLGGDEFCLIAPLAGNDAESLIDRACHALSERGEAFEVTTSFGAIVLPDDADDPSDALRFADERLYAQKLTSHAGRDRTMHMLLHALWEREPALHAHQDVVAGLAVETGRILGLRRDELDELNRAAQLHDLGKLAVPDDILHKNSHLDEREWEFVRQHTIVGERILRASPALRSVASIVRSTHERWDGTGYPDGLAGEDIPLGARIVFACDSYDAMTSTRPYGEALRPEEALAELERRSGTQFDPAVVRVLVGVVRSRVEVRASA
jgi:two-component system cell cycle response regulator